MSGRKSWIAISAPEASFGGGGTPLQKLEVINFSLPIQQGMIPDPSLYNARSRRALYQGGYYYRGTFTVRTNYEGNLELWRAILRGYASALVETGVRDHTIKEGALEPSYEIQASVGDLPVGKVFRYVGALLLAANTTWTAGNGPEGMGQTTFDVWSKDCTSDFTPTGTPAFPATLPVLHHEAITVDDGTADTGANLRVKSVGISFEQPNDEEDYFIGSKNPDKPSPTDFFVPKWRFTQVFLTRTAFEAAKNFTNGTPRLVFQHPTTIGASSKRELEIRSEKAVLETYESPVESYGKIIATAVWQAYYDPTDLSAIVMRFRNTESALP